MLEGVITDSSGAAIAGAKVTIVQLGGSLHYETTSDAQGHYTIVNAAIGSYHVTVDASGFKAATSQVTVIANQAVTADIQLDVSVTAQSVAVLSLGSETRARPGPNLSSRRPVVRLRRADQGR